jgi:uncharacterized Ntn-hydrolase superfamily protein
MRSAMIWLQITGISSMITPLGAFALILLVTAYSRAPMQGRVKFEHPNSPRIFTTFSMVARCLETFALGVCVATAVPAVGSVVPHVESRVGAIATQAHTNISYGIKGLELLKRGLSPQTALQAMLKEDSKRELRQVIIIDKDGRTGGFTGKKTADWKGHLVGANYVVAGNMLVGKEVIEAMAHEFESSEGELSERLMKALEAGQRAGGDKRGKKSAALHVMNHQETRTRPFLDLRVDLHPEPVRELRRICDAYREWVFHNKR